MGGLHVHILAIAQSPAEEQRLLHSGSSCVGVELLHVARHASKAGLLFGVTIDSDVALNLTSCNTEAQLATAPSMPARQLGGASGHKEWLLLNHTC